MYVCTNRDTYINTNIHTVTHINTYARTHAQRLHQFREHNTHKLVKLLTFFDIRYNVTRRNNYLYHK